MQRNGGQRGRNTPIIFVLGGGIASGAAILALLFSILRTVAPGDDAVAAMLAPRIVDIAILTGVLVLLVTGMCLHALRPATGSGGHVRRLFRQADRAAAPTQPARGIGDDDVTDAARAGRQQLDAEIRCGLINGEFDVAYQPICHATTHEVEAVEALVRWPRRPDGELGPDAFIGAADSSGIIHRLGLFVLQRACSDMADLEAVRLHVNISPVQFRHPEFEAQVQSILDETGFPAHRLELEITERHILENAERARAVIMSLAARGIGFALDDFGAGVSGIGHLQRFGLRRVKIDRALVATIGSDPQAGALLTGAISIAHALSLSVVAEGVETEDQEKLLRLVGCDLLQGYRFGRPAYFGDIAGRLGGAANDRQVAAQA